MTPSAPKKHKHAPPNGCSASPQPAHHVAPRGVNNASAGDCKPNPTAAPVSHESSASNKKRSRMLVEPLLNWIVKEDGAAALDAYKTLRAAQPSWLDIDISRRLLHLLCQSAASSEPALSLFDDIKAHLDGQCAAYSVAISNGPSSLETMAGAAPASKDDPEKLQQKAKKKLESIYALMIKLHTARKELNTACAFLDRATTDTDLPLTLRLFSPLLLAFSQSNKIEGTVKILRHLTKGEKNNTIALKPALILNIISAFGRDMKFKEANELLIKLGGQLSTVPPGLLPYTPFFQDIFSSSPANSRSSASNHLYNTASGTTASSETATSFVPAQMTYLYKGGPAGSEIEDADYLEAKCGHCASKLGVNDLNASQLEDFRKYLHWYITTSTAGHPVRARVQALKYFINWMYSRKPYDIFLDGANIAFYAQNNTVSSPDAVHSLSSAKEKRAFVTTTRFNYDQLMMFYKYVTKRYPKRRAIIFLHQTRITKVGRPEHLTFLEDLMKKDRLYIVPHGLNDDIMWMMGSILDTSVPMLENPVYQSILAYEKEIGYTLNISNLASSKLANTLLPNEEDALIDDTTPPKAVDATKKDTDDGQEDLSAMMKRVIESAGSVSGRDIEEQYTNLTFDAKYLLNESKDLGACSKHSYYRRMIITNDQLRDHDLRLSNPCWYMLWRLRHVVSYEIARNQSITLRVPPQYTFGLQYKREINPNSSKPTTYRWHIPMSVHPSQHPALRDKLGPDYKDFIGKHPHYDLYRGNPSCHVLWYCASTTY